MKIEIINSGSKQFPFYQIIIDKQEFCATNKIENAERIKSFLEQSVDITDEEIEQEALLYYPVNILNKIDINNAARIVWAWGAKWLRSRQNQSNRELLEKFINSIPDDTVDANKGTLTYLMLEFLNKK